MSNCVKPAFANCRPSIWPLEYQSNFSFFSTYATVLGYCNVGDDNWLGSGTTVTQRTNIGNDNTLNSGEYLFDDLLDRQIFQSGVTFDKPQK